MATHRIRYEGPPALTLDVATTLADAPGIELTSSGEPLVIDPERVAVVLTVDGSAGAVADAVSDARRRLPSGASLDADTDD